MSVAVAAPRSTLADLAQVDGKAELIGGRVVHFTPTGYLPNVAAGRIFRRLADYADAAQRGVAYTAGMGFAVPELASGRESFSPDAAYYTGPLPVKRMRFIDGAPDLAVEVRSEGDSGPAAEAQMAAKRADYFEAGTLVVWDVDPEAGVVRRHRPGEPAPAVFAAGVGGRRGAGRPRLAAGGRLAHGLSRQPDPLGSWRAAGFTPAACRREADRGEPGRLAHDTVDRQWRKT